MIRGRPRSGLAEGGLQSHVLICFPFLDLRFLVEGGISPGWLAGEFSNVGSLGRVVRSFGDGIEAEIRANPSLAFGNEYTRSLSGRGPRRQRAARDIGDGLSIAGRRVLADGEGQVRLEILVRDIRLSSENIENRLDRILTTPVYVVRESVTEMISAGFFVARRYISESEKTIRPASSLTTARLLQEGAGSPFVVVVHPQSDTACFDGTPLGEVPHGFNSVTCRLLELAGKTTGVWQVWVKPGADWFSVVRMLCRIICQLSEVASLIDLQQDPQALTPHLLNSNAIDRFFRVRGGQLRRKVQGGWNVTEVQRLAVQHLKASIDDIEQNKIALSQILRREVASDVASTIDRVKRNSEETPMLKSHDRAKLAEVLAGQSLHSSDYFRNLVIKAEIPIEFKQQRQHGWTHDGQVDALMLIDWAQGKGTNPANPTNTVLASVLLPELRNLGLEDIAIIIAIISTYRLIRDDNALTELRVRYHCPVEKSRLAPTVDIGPDIRWRGETDEVRLQSWLQRPSEFLDVGYLRKAIHNAASVCLIEVGKNGQTGTAVVVHEKYVLTNYHVIQSVMVGDKAGPDASDIRFRFGSYGGDSTVHNISIDAENPVIDFSPVDALDYVLLHVPQLSQISEIRPVPLSTSVPAVGSPVSILQHPHGGSMQLAASLDAVTFRDLDSGLIQYVTRTASGSSGAPCFDENWNLIALHHAERARPFGTIREGILMATIYNKISHWIGTTMQETTG